MNYSAIVSGMSGILFLIPEATAAAESYPLFNCDISVIISSSETGSDNPSLVSPDCPFCSLFSFPSPFCVFAPSKTSKRYCQVDFCNQCAAE